MNLFQTGKFELHSGGTSDFKIDCDALTDEDIKTIVSIIIKRYNFSYVVGIPEGGIRLAKALIPHCKESYPVLVVDDVLTTGASMKQYLKDYGSLSQGVVIFARGPVPNRVNAIFYTGIFQ